MTDSETNIIIFKEGNSDKFKEAADDILFILLITIFQGGVFLFILYNIANEFLFPITKKIQVFELLFLLISTFLPTIFLSFHYLAAKKFRHESFGFDTNNSCFVHDGNKIDLKNITQINYTDYNLTPPIRGTQDERDIIWEIITKDCEKFYFVSRYEKLQSIKNIFAENSIKPKFVIFKSANISIYLTVAIYLSFIVFNLIGYWGIPIVSYVALTAIINFSNN